MQEVSVIPKKRVNHTGSRNPILEQCWARTRKKTLAIAYLSHKLDYIAGRYGAKVALMASKELQKPWPTVQKKVEVVRKLWGFTVNTSTNQFMLCRTGAVHIHLLMSIASYIGPTG